MTAGRATKKPIPVEFMRWDGGPAAATRVIDWILENGGTARYHEEEPHDLYRGTKFETLEPAHIAIDTLEGTMRAVADDVIIRGVQGELYPCKPDIFAETYDITEEPS
jgi:hypothetical protein